MFEFHDRTVFFRFLAPGGAHFSKKGDSSGAGDARSGISEVSSCWDLISVL